MAQNEKVIFARVPAELHLDVKITAAREGVSVAQLVERAVRVYLAAT